MPSRHRPDRRPDYPKTPEPGSETSQDKDRHRELEQHHPYESPHPHPPHHAQEKSPPSPGQRSSGSRGEEMTSDAKQPGSTKPSKKRRKTGSKT